MALDFGAPLAALGGGGSDATTSIGVGVQALKDRKAPGLEPVPTLTDEVVLARMFQRKQRAAAMRGRASTFLTGPRGIGAGLPTSEMAMAMLRAGLDEPPDYATLGTPTDNFDQRSDPNAQNPRSPIYAPPGMSSGRGG